MPSRPTTDQPSTDRTPGAGRVVLLLALAGLLLGALLTNLGLALVEYDESRTLGAACEHAEATIHGAPGGLLVGLAAAAGFLLVRRRGGSVVPSIIGALVGGFVGLLLVSLLLWPLATNDLPVFVCAY